MTVPEVVVRAPRGHVGRTTRTSAGTGDPAAVHVCGIRADELPLLEPGAGCDAAPGRVVVFPAEDGGRVDVLMGSGEAPTGALLSAGAVRPGVRGAHPDIAGPEWLHARTGNGAAGVAVTPRSRLLEGLDAAPHDIRSTAHEMETQR